MISAKNINYSYGDKNLFDNLSLTINAGERVCMVGRNGAGKSTLMRILYNEEPQKGEVLKNPNLRIGFLQQEAKINPNLSVLEAMRLSMKEHSENIAAHKNLCEDLADEKDPKEIKRLANQIAALAHLIEVRGGFDLEYQIEKVLTRLSINAREQTIGSLSGGELRRVDLARVLLYSPDLYLLDEPTNHLDVEAISFLVQVLRTNNATSMIISHDRVFIDEVATKIIELSNKKIFSHTPPFANYLERKLVRELIESQSIHRSQRILVGELDWLRAGVKARTTKQNARIERAYALMEKVQKEEREKKQEKLSMSATLAKKFGRIILELKDICGGYNSKILFSNFSLLVAPRERYGIIGRNGTGKTTLVSIISKRLSPISGQVKWAKNTEIIVFDQKREALDGEKTLKETLVFQGDYVFVNEEPVHISAYLERYLFSKGDARRKVSTLSGGEKNRLLLAKLFLQSSNCIILDEPTNDLDEESLVILEDLLLDYPGAIFIVSHDRAFLNRVCTHIISLENQELFTYVGNYSTYKTLHGKTFKEQQVPKLEKKISKKIERKKDSEKLTYKEEIELKEIESKIEECETNLRDVNKEISQVDFYKKTHEHIKSRLDFANELEEMLNSFYARWQELSEKKPRR